MKLNRLLEITTVLMNKKTVTAGELAKRFGVSVRTIYRDIDVLSSSGVPVYSSKGTRGGISLLEEYTVNRTTLSSAERESLTFALDALRSTKYPQSESIIDKLGSIFNTENSDWIHIDFSPWGGSPNSYNKFVEIKDSVIHSRLIEIDYINSWNEESRRKIEPLRLIFKGRAWYLWSYCLSSEDFRTFKVSRIKNVAVLNESFKRGRTYSPKESPPKHNPEIVHLVLEFTQDALYRLYDDFDFDMIHVQDGAYRVEVDFPEDEWVYGFILSYGTFVKVLEPPHIQEIIKERGRKIAEYY